MSFTEKDEPNGDRQAGDQSQRALVAPALFIHVSTEPKINGSQTDRIDRNEERDEREQKFFQIKLHADCDLITACCIPPSVKAWLATIPLMLSF